MSDLVERRVPVPMYLYKPDQHDPLDDDGLKWLADQLCSESRVDPGLTMSCGWIPYQAAYEFPYLIDRIEQLETALRFYADNHGNPNDGPWGVNSDDFGFIARQALQETGNEHICA